MSPNKMLTKDDQEKSIILAEKTLAECGIDTVPVDVYQIAAILGFRIIKIDRNDFSGAIEKKSKIIFLNKNETEQRQRFTIAHEIGHLLLGHGDVVDFRTNKVNYKEIIANEFAGNLLVPKTWLIHFRSKGFDDISLSKLFDVSYECIISRKINTR